MRDLDRSELLEVSGGAELLGRSAAKAVMEIGDTLDDLAHDLIEWWLPVADDINSIIR